MGNGGRGFDQLMTPAGILLVVGSMFLVTFIIIFGGVYMRVMSDRDRKQRQAERDKLNEKKP